MDGEDISNSGEALAMKIAEFAAGFCLDSNIWRMLGFKRRPKRGSFFTKFVKSDVLVKENFILRELYVSCIADCINAVANTYVVEYRFKIAARAIEIMLLYDGCIESYGFDTYHEASLYLTNCLKDYFNNEEASVVFVTHATNILGKYFNPAWLVNSPQIFSGDTLFSLKIYFNKKFSQPLIDDIELYDYKIMELLQNGIS